MATDTKVQLAFRAKQDMRDRLGAIAEAENRTIAQTLFIMVQEQIKRYDQGGMSAVMEGN